MTASVERKWVLARGNLVELKVDCLMQLERKIGAEKNQGGEHSTSHLRFL